eukprot:UN17255
MIFHHAKYLSYFESTQIISFSSFLHFGNISSVYHLIIFLHL